MERLIGRKKRMAFNKLPTTDREFFVGRGKTMKGFSKLKDAKTYMRKKKLHTIREVRRV